MTTLQAFMDVLSMATSFTSFVFEFRLADALDADDFHSCEAGNDVQTCKSGSVCHSAWLLGAMSLSWVGSVPMRHLSPVA